MFDKCIPCQRLGENCVPNLWLLPFPELVKWCIKKQKHLGWSNQILADRSHTPVGTINRIWAGEYLDCKFSTIKSVLIALIGGTTDEFSCSAQVEKELRQMEQLEQQAAKLTAVEAENEMLKEKLSKIDELHRQDIRAVREEYMGQITFLMDELKAWRSMNQKRD